MNIIIKLNYQPYNNHRLILQIVYKHENLILNISNKILYTYLLINNYI